MISERTLKKWRGEALEIKQRGPIEGTMDALLSYSSKMHLCEHILKMTQELLDQQLVERQK